MRLVIELIAGTWKIEVNGRSEFADTLEQLIEKADPGAPLEYTMHTTSILSGLFGLPYEPDWVLDEGHFDFQKLADAMWGSQDDADHWEPEVTDEQPPLPDEFLPAEGVVERIQEYTEGE